MDGQQKTIELEWAFEGGDSSLHEFILHEINPLLDRGWTVADLRVETPGRIAVILVRAPVGIEAAGVV